MTLLALAAGLLLLIGGGEALVRGAVAAATRLGVSPLVIGLTLVGFGTSTPELAASLDAALSGAPGLAVGNVVGSNIANILLILGLAAVISPVAAPRDAFRRDGAALVAASLLMLGACLTGGISRIAGLVFLALLGAYTLLVWRSERATAPASSAPASSAPGADRAAPRAQPAEGGPGLGMGLALVAGGVAAIVLGADLLVGAARELARAAGLSDTVIGLTLVAVGTSLPELVTSVMAARRGRGDVAFGNVLGSNLFNILGIAGATAAVAPLAAPPRILAFDIWAMLAAAALLVVFAWTGRRITRAEGACLLLAYAACLVLQLGAA